VTRKIRETFDVVLGLVQPLIPDVTIRLLVGTPQIEREHAKSERVFAMTVGSGKRPNDFEIHVAREFEYLIAEARFGIAAHEIGHVFSMYEHDDDEEHAADLFMLERFQIPLEHGTRLNVQFVPHDLIGELKRLYRNNETLDDLRWSPVTNESYRRKMLNASPYEK
jgi:hypothetical protein